MSNLLSLPMLVMRSLACLEADSEAGSNASIACLTSIAAFDKAPLNETGRGDNLTALPPHPEASEYKYWALALCIVPLLTICGNSLVILAVVRVRALHSAINYFIMGLAAADLCVGLTVMPHAVYTELRAGKWLLGQIWCDFYCTTDVACSTASIFTLTVISFDRYRAVKFPIQYSKETRNVRRVAFIIAGVWLISFATASPMFLGINRPPEGELAHEECRFYNADYILYSSLVSFGIPLMIVLFVYARIMIAIRERERLSRERKANVAAMAERRKSRSVAVTQATNDPERPMLTNSASAQEQSATVSELGVKASESSPPPTKPNAILSPGSDGPRSNGGVVPGKDGIPLISFPSTDRPEPEPASIQQEEETEPMDIQLNTSSANASLHFSLASRTDTKASVEYSPSCVEEMSFIDESLSPASRSSAAAFSALSGSPKEPNLGMGVPTANQPRSATHPCLSKEGDCVRLSLEPSVTALVSYISLNFVSADDASSLGGGSLPTDSERSHFGDYFLSPPPSPDSAPLLSAVSPTPPSLRFPLSLAAQETLDEESEAALVHMPTSPPKMMMFIQIRTYKAYADLQLDASSSAWE